MTPKIREDYKNNHTGRRTKGFYRMPRRREKDKERAIGRTRLTYNKYVVTNFGKNLFLQINPCFLTDDQTLYNYKHVRINLLQLDDQFEAKLVINIHSMAILSND